MAAEFHSLLLPRGIMTGMTDELAIVLQQFRTGLEAMYGERLDRVLLYGSRARGDAVPESDVDFLTAR